MRVDVLKVFVFRMGELHAVFCALKTIGKVINGSCLDQSFVQAGIYGTTTFEQVKGGKHLDRCFELFLTLYLSLYKLYLQKLIEKDPLVERTA